MERRWNPTLGFLIDLLTINQLKQSFIHDKRDEITKEIDELVNDIQLLLPKSPYPSISAEFIRDVIILAQYNAHIWINEAAVRDGTKEVSNLRLTHGLNSIRNMAKNRINSVVGGRREYKLDNVEAYPEWVPSGYENKNP